MRSVWRAGILMIAMATTTQAQQTPTQEETDIETLERELAGMAKMPERQLREGEKPLQWIDPQKLIGEILHEMESASKTMEKTGSAVMREQTPALLKEIDAYHFNTISDINKLIDYAKQQQQARAQRIDEPQNREPSRREPGNNEDSSDTSGAPARDSYVPDSGTSGSAENRTAVDADRWGDLPAKKRDAVVKSGQAGPINKYSHENDEYRDKVAKESKKK